VNNLHELKSNEYSKSKYDELIEYLKQDDGYWLENDKWDATKNIFFNKKIDTMRFIDFTNFKNEQLKNEIKYYLLYNFKGKLLSNKGIIRLNRPLQHLSRFLNCKSLIELNKENTRIKWVNFLIQNGVSNYPQENTYFGLTNDLINFIQNFYDEREEIEKDIWYSKNIKGAKLSATSDRKSRTINFNKIPIYYRETVKKYLKTIITKRSWSMCFETVSKLNYFFGFFYSNNYSDGFIESLSREDIEKYVFYAMNERKDKYRTQTTYYITYIRKFLNKRMKLLL
jgi:hypothetical protein